MIVCSSQRILTCFVFTLYFLIFIWSRWFHLYFMGEEIDFQRDYGFTQGCTAQGWQGQSPDQFSWLSKEESSKCNLGWWKPPTSGIASIRNCFLDLGLWENDCFWYGMDWPFFFFFSFILPPMFYAMSYLYLNMNDC